MDAARRLAQLVECQRELVLDLGHLADEQLSRRGRFLDGREPKLERDEPLLRAVMEISLDPATSFVGRGDDPPARGGELRFALSVRDSGRDELGEVLEPFLAVGRQELVRGRDVHRAP